MSSHIVEIGLHGHEWATVHTTGTVYLQACKLCGSRRAIGSDPRFKPTPTLADWQRAWLEGAELPEAATQ